MTSTRCPSRSIRRLFAPSRRRSIFSPFCFRKNIAEARKLIGVAMEMVNLKITCAGEAEMALTVLEDNPFDLIFLDVNLPQTSGLDIATKVRQLEDHKKTPIIFLTGMTDFKT